MSGAQSWKTKRHASPTLLAKLQKEMEKCQGSLTLSQNSLSNFLNLKDRSSEPLPTDEVQIPAQDSLRMNPDIHQLMSNLKWVPLETDEVAAESGYNAWKLPWDASIAWTDAIMRAACGGSDGLLPCGGAAAAGKTCHGNLATAPKKIVAVQGCTATLWLCHSNGRLAAAIRCLPRGWALPWLRASSLPEVHVDG
ncbi:hypothetical protein AK812_SmicGene39774 [Symbiodinium microadriaticum]|uniref:Uncharacterized protein n=1 Tax=Symbiodinium microadriaticum TaxID=2951 RepID=A0A1Q9CAE2_SYMMI|nr:hypothetical protein AK812_SmicGene39774 [Symbiodinium microadriaticum]